MPVPSCFYYCSSVIELDVRDGDASGSSCIIQDCFGYPGFLFLFLFFHMKLMIVLSRSLKNCWDFDEDWIAFGRIANFTMLILPIQEHFQGSSSIFFFK